jgi:hypothetical protein
VRSPAESLARSATRLSLVVRGLFAPPPPPQLPPGLGPVPSELKDAVRPLPVSFAVVCESVEMGELGAFVGERPRKASRELNEGNISIDCTRPISSGSKFKQPAHAASSSSQLTQPAHARQLKSQLDMRQAIILNQWGDCDWESTHAIVHRASIALVVA